MKILGTLTSLEERVSSLTDFEKLDRDREIRKIETVRCDNCGSIAERHYLLNSQFVRTQCASCDYLMITCSRTGRVVEAHGCGIYGRRCS